MRHTLWVMGLCLGLFLVEITWVGLGYAEGGQFIPKETLEGVGTRLAGTFTFQPFTPSMPDHLWMKADSDKVTFLHFAKPVNESGNTLLFMGDGIKGRFCAEDQPAKGKTGYVHFHSTITAKGHEHDHGHGGEKNQEGYWLRHIAVGEFDMMGMHFTPGVAYMFMPTQPPKCK